MIDAQGHESAAFRIDGPPEAALLLDVKEARFLAGDFLDASVALVGRCLGRRRGRRIGVCHCDVLESALEPVAAEGRTSRSDGVAGERVANAFELPAGGIGKRPLDAIRIQSNAKPIALAHLPGVRRALVDGHLQVPLGHPNAVPHLAQLARVRRPLCVGRLDQGEVPEVVRIVDNGYAGDLPRLIDRLGDFQVGLHGDARRDGRDLELGHSAIAAQRVDRIGLKRPLQRIVAPLVGLQPGEQRVAAHEEHATGEECGEKLAWERHRGVSFAAILAADIAKALRFRRKHGGSNRLYRRNRPQIRPWQCRTQ